MTRSSDLVMVPREPTDEMLEAGEATFVPGHKGTPVSTPAEVYAAMIAAALQSVEGGVQGAAKQESCPESAPRTETAIVTALRECQRVLAMMIDPASIKSTSVIYAFTAATAAEAKARAALSGVTNSAPASRASHNSGERDPSVMPDCPGADTKSDGGVEGHAISGTGPALEQSRQPETPSAGIKPGPSDAQLTKTPSADHDAGNLRGLAESTPHQPHALSQGWQDIETAPKDRTWFLATDGTEFFRTQGSYGHVWIANGRGGHKPDPMRKSFSWLASEFNSLSPWHPTHWMPLPAPPVPENTPRDSSESTTGGSAPDHTTMEER